MGQTETNFHQVSEDPPQKTQRQSAPPVSPAPGSQQVHLLLQLVTSAALLLQLLSQRLHIRLLFKLPQLLL